MLEKLVEIGKKLSPELKKILGNIGWLFAEKIVTLIFTFAVGIYVIRYLGSEQFGQLSYGISYIGLFLPIAQLGLNTVVVRDIVQTSNLTMAIVGTSFFLKLQGGLLACLLILVTAPYFSPDAQSEKLSMLLAIGLILTAFESIEFWFESQVLSGVLAMIRSLQVIVSSSVKLIFIFFHFSVAAFALLMIGEQIFKASGVLFAYRKHGQNLFKWIFNRKIAYRMLKDSFPLILSGVMVTLYMKIDQIMLGTMSNSSAVGNYAAAVRFSEIWYVIPMAIFSSVFPSILKARERSLKEYYNRLQQLYDVMAWISITIAVLMTFLATPLLIHLLGMEYRDAGPILSVHIWSAIFVFLGVARTSWLLAENYTQFNFWTNLLGAIVNIVLNFILIPDYQGMGAAIATLVSYAIASHISCLFYPPLFKTGWMLTKALFIPFRFRQNMIYLRAVKQLIQSS